MVGKRWWARGREMVGKRWQVRGRQREMERDGGKEMAGKRVRA